MRMRHVLTLHRIVVLGLLATLALKNRQALDHTREYDEQESVAAAGERRPAMG